MFLSYCMHSDCKQCSRQVNLCFMNQPEGILSVLMPPGQVTGPSQGKSSGGAATLMPLDLHAFLQQCVLLAEWAQF